jgi:hypothetical protein
VHLQVQRLYINFTKVYRILYTLWYIISTQIGGQIHLTGSHWLIVYEGGIFKLFCYVAQTSIFLVYF